VSDSNELPSNWVRAPLGELGDWYGGGTPSKANEKFWSNGKIPWFSPKDMKAFRLQSSEDRITRAAVDSSSVDVFPRDTVLMVVRSGILAHTFPVAVVGVEATMNQDLKGVVPKDGVDATYLAYALRSYGRDILNQCSKAGTTVASIDTLALHGYWLPLAPTNEQQRVVEKLDELLSHLDAGTAALERARANLKRYRAAVLKAAVEGRLTETWRAAHPAAEPAGKLLERILAERRKKWEEAQLEKFAEKGHAPPKGWKDKYVAPAKPDVAAMPKLPRSWFWSSLGECFPVVVGSTPSRGNSRYWHGDVNWVSSGEVQFSRISETKERITTEGLANSSARMNPKGSVLLGMIGEGKTRGQAAILDIAAANNQNCAAIWVSETEVLPEFVYFWLWSRYEITRSGGSGNNQPALNKSLVEQIPFPLPPIEEQREIVLEVDKYCSNLEHSVAALEVMGIRSSRLRRSILKRAFEGKLVPQDPNDEPASELLARIRAGRPAGKGLTGQGNGRSEICQKIRNNME
jgi:type I restriction enzyme, S subunit